MRLISLLELDDCRAIVNAAQVEADRRGAVVSRRSLIPVAIRC
jgi:hypothetical protein